MVKLQVILGSTRPNRIGEGVAKWTAEQMKKFDGIEVELVDVADYNLPLLDEPMPPSLGNYSKEHTKKWAAKIAEADGYVFVTPEYNHSVPGAMKNAIDFLYSEWNNKAVGFVGYGSNGGSRAIEQWRQIAAEIQMADVRGHLLLSLVNDFENYSVFKPKEQHEQVLSVMLGQLTSWAEALKAVRQKLA